MLTEHMSDVPEEMQEHLAPLVSPSISATSTARPGQPDAQVHLPADDGGGPRRHGGWTTSASYEEQPLGVYQCDDRTEPRCPSTLADAARSLAPGWNAFWFTPADPTLLGLIRVLTGLMLLYTHAVWGLALADFFGPSGWLSVELVRTIQAEQYRLLVLVVGAPAGWARPRVLSMVVLALFTIGLWTRATSILALIVATSYAHRVPEATVRPRPDQHHADALPGDRAERPGGVGRPLARPAVAGRRPRSRPRASGPTCRVG